MLNYCYLFLCRFSTKLALADVTHGAPGHNGRAANVENNKQDTETVTLDAQVRHSNVLGTFQK